MLVAGHTRDAGLVELLTPAAEIAAVLVVLDPPRVLEIAPLRHMGRISYGVYLWSFPMVSLFSPLRVSISLPLILVSTVAIAALSYAVLERRFLSSTFFAARPSSALWRPR